MGRLSWIFRVASKCHHNCPYTKEAEGDYSAEVEKATMTMKAEIPGLQPQAKEY